jgi:hypothetical protein
MLKNILSLESNYTDFDKFRNNTTIDLIRALSNGNKNNINKKDSALKIIKEKIISTGKNILCANKSLISNNLIWKPAYIKSIFETNYNEPLNVNLPENTDCDNIILKYKFNDPSSVSGQLLDNNNLSGNPNYSTPGSISGEEPETNDSLNGYYSGNSKDEIKIISATCLYPASGSGFVQWSTTYEGSHGYVIYLCDTPTPSITNYTIENPISTQSITADAGGHTTIYNELLSNLKRYQYKIKALYIIILKSNTEICSNGLEIQYTDIPYNTTYNGAYSETYYQETTDLPPYYGSKNTYLSKEKEISTATTTTTTIPH